MYFSTMSSSYSSSSLRFFTYKDLPEIVIGILAYSASIYSNIKIKTKTYLLFGHLHVLQRHVLQLVLKFYVVLLWVVVFPRVLCLIRIHPWLQRWLVRRMSISKLNVLDLLERLLMLSRWELTTVQWIVLWWFTTAVTSTYILRILRQIWWVCRYDWLIL